MRVELQYLDGELNNAILHKEKIADTLAPYHLSDEVIGELTRSETVTDAEDLGKTVIEAFPESAMAEEYRTLAKKLIGICGIERS